MDRVCESVVYRVTVDLPLPPIADFGSVAVATDPDAFMDFAEERGASNVVGTTCPAYCGVECEADTQQAAASIAAGWRAMTEDIPAANWTAQVDAEGGAA